MVIDPRAVAVDVDLGGDVEGFVVRVFEAELERLLVVAGEEVGMGGLVGLHFGLVPWAIFDPGVAEFPDLIDGSGPEPGLAITGAEDVRIVGREFVECAVGIE